ncbi:MAG: hypothetical protein IT426_19315 [Pirellulales bacterium]|nr:hypothetical protein [Pirellulales bacterium]
MNIRALLHTTPAFFLCLLTVLASDAQVPQSPAKEIRSKAGFHEIDVMVIIYDPVFAKHGNVKLSEYFKWNDSKKLSIELAEVLTEASGGFAKYRLAAIVNSDSYPVKIDGFLYDESSFLEMWADRDKSHQPDRSSYKEIFNKHGIEQKVRQGKIDEVWLWGAPYMGFDEYAMKIPGDKLYYQTNNPWYYRPYDIPDCGKTVWVMGFNYERGLAEAVHSFGHRCEGILSLTVGKGKWYDAEPGNPWRTFSLQEKEFPGQAAVGNVHGGPNAESGYDYANAKAVFSTAEDWLNYPHLTGKKTSIDKEAWGGPDYHLNYMKWYLNHLPKAPGATDGFYDNWWQYVVNYDAAVKKRPPPGGKLEKIKTAMFE